MFRPEQRDQILNEVGKETLEQDSRREASNIVDEVIRFSVRNGPAVRGWIEEALRTRTAAELIQVVALWFQSGQDEILTVLESRPDKPAIARALLEFWPGSDVGDWAAERIEAAAALDYALTEGWDKLLAIRSLAAVEQKPDSALPAALSLALANRSLQLGWTIKRAHAELAGLARPGGYGMPEALLIKPGDTLLPTEPRLAMKPLAEDRPITPFTLYFNRRFTGLLTHAIFPPVFVHTFVPALARAFVPAFTRDFSNFFANDFARDFARDFTRAYFFTSDLALNFEVEVASRPTPPAPPGTIDSAQLAHSEAWLDSETWLAHLRKATTSKQAELFQRKTAFLVGEALIALAATVKSSDRERRSYFLLRLQNRCLLEIWPGLDGYLSEPPGLFHLAIYYALAWTQYSTTWIWPQTERWLELFGEKPHHWLPRAHWHLCWLTFDPELKEHIKALDEALREGEADSVLPGYASAFRKILSR